MTKGEIDHSFVSYVQMGIYIIHTKRGFYRAVTQQKCHVSVKEDPD